MNKIIFSLSIIFFTFKSIAVHTLIPGNEIGNGGDNTGVGYRSAWFLGTQPVKYCYELSYNFGLDSSQVELYISKSIANWKNYIEYKGIPFNDPSFKPALQYISNGECQGDEDLKFYLGTEDQQVVKDKQVFTNPTAFARKTHNDFLNGWGKGYIWIAPPRSVYPKANFPDWSKGYTFQGMITHEIGHILGIADHVEGTIMASSLTSWLQMSENFEKRAQAVLTSIDDKQELYSCEFCPIKLSGSISKNQTPENAETFRLFMERTPIGKIRSTYEVQVLATSVKRILTIEDDKSSKSFTIQWTPNANSQTTQSNKLFYAVRGEKKEGSKKLRLKGYSFSTTSKVQLGTISANNKTFQIIIEQNTSTIDSSPIKIQYINNNNAKNLFSSFLKGMQ